MVLPEILPDCTSPITRGNTTTCTVTAPSGATVSGWKFQDGSGNTVTTSSSNRTWSGVMVTSGTVSVTASVSGATLPLSFSVTVNIERTVPSPPSTQAKSAGTILSCYDGTNTNLPSPPAANSGEGFSCADLAYSFNFSTVNDNGPNNGYEYVTSASDASGNQPTKFEFIVVSDLLSATTFYNYQCGNYSRSNSNGFIAGSQLKQNVFDHESGSILSHWTEYRDAQNNASNNVGTVLESTAPPGSTGSTFAQQAGNAALQRIAQSGEQRTVRWFRK